VWMCELVGVPVVVQEAMSMKALAAINLFSKRGRKARAVAPPLRLPLPKSNGTTLDNFTW